MTEHFTGSGVQINPITAPSGQLMHSKYLVRDVGHRGAAVWTGSANFTDDAWTRQENNILTLTSARLAAGYRGDFEQLWAAGSIKKTGAGDAGATTVGRVKVDWDFAPADGQTIDALLTAQVAAATSRIVLSTMVLTSSAAMSLLLRRPRLLFGRRPSAIETIRRGSVR